ncbi:MAG: hypothetical protein Ct9H300mP28_16770 [Pseudomonadota bacterium]|nr:MAG: hypothetical protein Ct9H300mP28_16770 [Pseudomonadota bacterium]
MADQGITMVGGQSEAVLESDPASYPVYIDINLRRYFFLYGRNAALVTLLILCTCPISLLAAFFCILPSLFLFSGFYHFFC